MCNPYHVEVIFPSSGSCRTIGGSWRLLDSCPTCWLMSPVKGAVWVKAFVKKTRFLGCPHLSIHDSFVIVIAHRIKHDTMLWTLVCPGWPNRILAGLWAQPPQWLGEGRIRIRPLSKIVLVVAHTANSCKIIYIYIILYINSILPYLSFLQGAGSYSGQRSGFAHFIHAAVDLAKMFYGDVWPRHVLFTDYQVIDRLFLWSAQGEPETVVVLLRPSCTSPKYCFRCTQPLQICLNNFFSRDYVLNAVPEFMMMRPGTMTSTSASWSWIRTKL